MTSGIAVDLKAGLPRCTIAALDFVLVAWRELPSGY
jgi:hypothetical protein